MCYYPFIGNIHPYLSIISQLILKLKLYSTCKKVYILLYRLIPDSFYRNQWLLDMSIDRATKIASTIRENFVDTDNFSLFQNRVVEDSTWTPRLDVKLVKLGFTVQEEQQASVQNVMLTNTAKLEQLNVLNVLLEKE